MTLDQYLQENGTGSFKNFRVPDLIPGNGGQVEALLVMESPHIDELRTGLPLAGDAGQRALAFLLPTGRPPEALGPYVSTLHARDDVRIGILNACPVPLQSRAFTRHRLAPVLSQSDWALLEEVRSHRASTIAALPTPTVKRANILLLPGLQSRMASVNLSPNAMIFIAGNFVHRTWASLVAPPKRRVLSIPHPSNGWWSRTEQQLFTDNLAALRTQFARLTS